MSASYNSLTPRDGPDASGPVIDVYAGDLDTLHDKLVSWFEEAERASIEPRELSERDRDYYDHTQWTKAELDELRKRGQPPITINKMHDKVELLCGLERKARTDPKAFPRTPTEEERAEAATQALRYIDDDNNYPVIRSLVFNNMLVEGTGAVEHTLEDDGKGGADIRQAHVSWERLWWDPHSRALDFSDARYRGLVIWMDREQLVELYPNAGDDVIGDSFDSVDSGTYGDRPSDVAWTDTKRERTRVVQCHWSERGIWWTATYSKAGILSEPQQSKFKDRRGKSACGLLMQSAYIDRNNWRYGMVRGLISLQDEINKRRSKALHLLSVHQVVAEQGAVKDVDYARRQVARPDGYIEITPGMKFEIQPGGELATGQFHLLQHATAEMQLSGPNAAMSGTDSRELSGRAILAQQAGGAVQNEPLADSLRMFSRRVYEMCWMAAREYWTGGKWVRVTDALNDTRWVGINHAVTVQEELAAMTEQERAMTMQQMQLMPGDPRLQQVIRVENDITDLDVDINIEEGQDIPTMAAENFQTLVQLAGMQPGLIPGDVLIAASSLRNKDDLLQRMKQHMEAQQQKEQAAAPLMKRHAEAEVAGKEAKAAADAALAKERNVAAAGGVHSMHADFNAPPYGQPHVAPDAPSAPGTVMPMAAHAGGGLVRRTAPAEHFDFNSRLQQGLRPGDDFVDPRMPVIDPSQFTADPRLVFPGNPMPPPEWVPPPQPLATGGPVRRTLPPEDYRTRLQELRGSGVPGADPQMQIDPSQFTADQLLQVPRTWDGSGWVPMPGDRSRIMAHATGGPIAQMTGGDPAGPDDGWITAKAGEYVLNQGAVAKYGQPLLDAINSGAIDPKVLELAAGHAVADLREKHARAAMTEAKVGSEAARTNDLLHAAVLKVAQVRQMHHEQTHPQPAKPA